MNTVYNFFKDEKGATAIEYAFIASLVSIAIVGGLLLIGPRLSGIFQDVSVAL